MSWHRVSFEVSEEGEDIKCDNAIPSIFSQFLCKKDSYLLNIFLIFSFLRRWFSKALYDARRSSRVGEDIKNTMNPPPRLPRLVLSYTLDPNFPGARAPQRSKPGRAGWDLTLPKSVRLTAHKLNTIDLGIRVEIPPGYYGLITGRSSFPRNFNATVVEGIIDTGYSKNLFVMIRSYDILNELLIEEGTKICQLIIQPYTYDVTWFEDKLIKEYNSIKQ